MYDCDRCTSMRLRCPSCVTTALGQPFSNPFSSSTNVSWKCVYVRTRGNAVKPAELGHTALKWIWTPSLGVGPDELSSRYDGALYGSEVKARVGHPSSPLSVTGVVSNRIVPVRPAMSNCCDKRYELSP